MFPSKLFRRIPLFALFLASCGGQAPDDTGAVAQAVSSAAEDGLHGVSLPAELNGTVVHFLRRLRRPNEPAVDHRLSVALQTPTAIRARLVRLRLVAPSGRLVLDAASGVGGWGDDDGNFSDRYFARDVTEGEVGDGSYQLQLELRDAGASGGSFAVERAWATTDVQTLRPVNIPFGSTISLNPPRPTLEFKDFTSPQFRTGERRELEVYVTHLLSTGDWREQFRRQPAVGTTRLLPDHDFERGEHRLAVIFREARDAGPLVLKRESETLIRFFTR